MTTTAPYRLELSRGRIILALLPELNDVPWSDIERIGSELVQRLQEVPAPALLVDLCALHYMGSAQVALVVRLFKAVKEKSGRMVVANCDAMVQEVLTLAGLDKLWTISPSADDALRLLGGGRDADGRPSGGSWQAWLGAVCVFISIGGLLALLAQVSWLPGDAAIWVEFVAAALGFLFGLWSVLQKSGGSRTVGGSVLVASVALLLASVFELGALRGRQEQLDSKVEQSPRVLATHPTSRPAVETSVAISNEIVSGTDPTDAAPADAANPAQL